MASADAVDIILRLQNLQRFVAGTREAAAGVRGIGVAAKEGSAEAQVSTGKLASMAGLASKAWKASAAGIAIAAIEGTKMAVTFDQHMEMIHTQSGARQSEVVARTKDILAMTKSGQYGQGPDELAQALFRLEGAGYRGTNAMKALRAASNLASVGNANVEDTTKTLTQAMKPGIKGIGDFNSAVAQVNATVGAGDMRLPQLVDALGTGVVTSAKQAGLSFKDVTGALAVFGDETNNVSGWSAQLATALHFLSSPSTKAKGALKEIGLGQYSLSKDMSGPNGLVTALKDLRSHLGRVGALKQKEILGSILPGGRGRVLSVLLNQVDLLQKKENQVAGTTKNFGEAVKKTHQTAAFKIHAAWAQTQAYLISFGHVLEPVAVLAAQGLAKLMGLLVKIPHAIGDVVKWFRNLPGPVKAILIVVGLIVAQVGIAYAAFMLWKKIVIVWEMIRGAILTVRIAMMLLWSSMGPVGLAIMALIAIGVLMATHWKQTKAVMVAVWNAIKHAFNASINFIVGVVHYGINWLKKNWTYVLVFVMTGALGLIVLYVIRHFNQILHFIEGLPGKINKLASGMWNGIWDAFKWVINQIIGGLEWLIRHIGVPGFHVGPVHFGGFHPFGSVSLPRMQHGGNVIGAGAALVGEVGPEVVNLPAGAQVQPLTGSNSVPLLNGSLPDHITVIEIDRREVARAVGKHTSDRNARK